MAVYSIMFINVITPLHNGAGESTGFIDNPIIRERTTSFPFVQAASIKGVFRDSYEVVLNSNAVYALFGPEPDRGEEHIGSVSFGEGQLLAFPIRSLKGCFVWATSLLILHRLYQRLNIAGIEYQELEELLSSLSLPLDHAYICKGSTEQLLFTDNKLLLEEFPKDAQESDKLKKFTERISTSIFSEKDTFLKKEFEKKFVILPEDSFRYFVENTTEIVPNIRIGEKGVTKTGSLRYTEYLPAETILYSLMTFEKSRINNNQVDNSAKNILLNTDKNVQEVFCAFSPEVIQLGGDETTGKGLVKLAFLR